ncbi:hypothetical protein GALMADRAFT_251579 [Galerina marginata CBS 339.88]|uniref:DFDF domain-containing protein n=1 Tax=Galerina marginata (strain CBS 339.88) TaxID=685588 RepID=A0A067T1F1_GALM3|nr:hypothetical protein GALMADRAFT_251579 [Galerina marginata CBS 339.88]
MGTEQRRPPNQFIAPVQDPYAYIIFRASEVKDLSVDETPPVQHNVHDDPAVLGAGGPAPKPYAPYPPQHQANGPPPPQPPVPTYAATAQGVQPQIAVPAQMPQQVQPVVAQPPPAAINRGGPPPNAVNRRPNPVHTAAASLETVERALGDLRVSNANTTTHNPRGGRRGQGGHRGGRGEAEGMKIPTADFDFQSSNAKFDKTAVSPGGTKANTEDGTNDGEAEAEKPAAETAYNPQKSFFDSLSSSSATPASGSGGGGGGGGGGGAPQGNGGRRGRGGASGAGRNRREEEREKNVATFGEPGGVGLLGPGSYVGGWGGYGRRGGRPRRGGGGGGRGGANNGPPQVQARG